MDTTVLDFLLSSISSASLVGIAIWLSRTWIKERLTASIHVETEERLAKLKSELEATNQKVRDLTSVAASANQQVESALLEHRIAAVKLVWETVQDWQQVTAATMFISVLTEDWIKQNASHHGTKSTFEQLLNGIEPMSFLKKQNRAFLTRPFLSEPAWALYFAYHSFLSTRLTKAMILTIPGLNHAEMLTRIGERELLAKSAPPGILAAYDKNAYAATEPYLHHLREEMLREFKEMLSGHRASAQALHNAAEVVQAAEALSATAQSSLAELRQK
jgi:hypothetical protein